MTEVGSKEMTCIGLMDGHADRQTDKHRLLSFSSNSTNQTDRHHMH